MWHEQMRSDRDDWIKVNWENIHSAFVSQYQQVSTHNLAQYSYGSVMHYGPQVCHNDLMDVTDRLSTIRDTVWLFCAEN